MSGFGRHAPAGDLEREIHVKSNVKFELDLENGINLLEKNVVLQGIGTLQAAKVDKEDSVVGLNVGVHVRVAQKGAQKDGDGSSENHLAKAEWEDSIPKIGWAKLSVSTSPENAPATSEVFTLLENVQMFDHIHSRPPGLFIFFS